MFDTKIITIFKEDWFLLSKNSLHFDQNSQSYSRNYDSSISILFQSIKEWKDIENWPIWDNIQCNLLILRGKKSDILTSQSIELMRKRGPPFQLVEFENVGHAPSLMDSQQINSIIQFLNL